MNKFTNWIAHEYDEGTLAVWIALAVGAVGAVTLFVLTALAQ